MCAGVRLSAYPWLSDVIFERFRPRMARRACEPSGELPPKMIDTHCHLDVADFGADRPEVLARARAAGITTMVCIGSGRDLGAAREAVRLAGVEPDVYA